MQSLQIENINPVLITQLETLAQLHGRSLNEEVKFLLQQVIQDQLRFYATQGSREQAKEAIARSQQRYAGRLFNDSTELIHEDRQR